MAVTLRERRKQMLREEILDTARTMVVEQGYAAMSMDDLAARIGISKPTLYAHFATKDALVVEAATVGIHAMVRLLEVPLAGEAAIERLLQAMRKFLEQHLEMHTLGIGPWPEIFRLICNDPTAFSYIQRIHARITELVMQSIADGAIDAQLDPEAVVMAFYGIASALHKSQVNSVQLSDPHRAAQSLVEIFIRGIRAG
jgi:AcrR family transcriptional regulator